MTSTKYASRWAQDTFLTKDHSNQGTKATYTWDSTGTTGLTYAVDFNGHKIKVATGTTSTDAVNYQQLQDAIAGLYWKDPVEAASTANIAIASALVDSSTIDGVTVSTGDRVLLKNQTAPAENGIYIVVASGAASRATDMDAGSEFPSAAVFVKAGTVAADTGWTCTNVADPTVDATAITFTQFTGAAGVPDATEGSGGGTKGKITVDNAGSGLSTAGLDITAGVLSLDLSSNDFENSGTTVQLKIDEAAGLESTASGLAINLEASSPSLQFSANELGLKINASGGLQKSASGTEIKLDSTTTDTFGGLSLSSNGIKVRASQGITFDSNGLALDLTTNAGLEFTGSGGTGTLGVKANTASGLENTASGVGINLDATSSTTGVNGSNELVASRRAQTEITIDAGDITAKYADAVSGELDGAPIDLDSTTMYVRDSSGNCSPPQRYGVDFAIVTNTTAFVRVSWDAAEAAISAGMDGDLLAGDILVMEYTYLPV